MIRASKDNRVKVVLQVLRQEPGLELTINDLKGKVNEQLKACQSINSRQLSWAVRYITLVLGEPIRKEARITDGNKLITYQYCGVAE